MGRGRNGGNRRGRIVAAQTAYTPARPLNAAGIREIARLQPEVAAQVKAFMKEHGIRKASFVNHAADYEMYLAEGAKLTFYAPNGNVKSGSMVGNNTVGAANTGFDYGTNQRTPPLPEGTWVVEMPQPYGGYSITVHYVGTPRLGG